MCPSASGAGGKKYAWKDHPLAQALLEPPTQNVAYTALHAYNVRVLQCYIWQFNDEHAAKQVETRWTIDGNVYVNSENIDESLDYWVHARGDDPGDIVYTQKTTPDLTNAGYNVDKRGLDVLIQVKLISAPGGRQKLYCNVLYETLEETT